MEATDGCSSQQRMLAKSKAANKLCVISISSNKYRLKRNAGSFKIAIFKKNLHEWKDHPTKIMILH